MADGSFERDKPCITYPGGWTSMAVLALLNAGVPVEDAHVKKGLAYLRKLEPGKTYVRAMQTMVFVEAGQPEDRQRIRDNVNWLIDARVMRNNQLTGWSYGKGPTASTDNSNTQYALLGLWAGRQAGVDINRQVWESIRNYYVANQDADGAWIYSRAGASSDFSRPSLTMTTAGLSGLLIAGMELNVGREVIQANGVALNCGIYEENQADRQGAELDRQPFHHRKHARTRFLQPLRPGAHRAPHRPALPRRPRLVSRRLPIPGQGPAGGRRVGRRRQLGRLSHHQHQLRSLVFVQGAHAHLSQQAGTWHPGAAARRSTPIGTTTATIFAIW